MKIIFFGTSSFGVPSLEALKISHHQILSIVTSADKPQGRLLKLRRSPVKEWTLQNKIPLFKYHKINSPESLNDLKKLQADLFVVISFGTIFSEELIRIPRLFALNVHSSLLPKYRGAAPIHWAIMNGDAETGVTVQKIAFKVDSGDILLQKKTAILPADDICSLEERLSGLGAAALIEGLDKIENGKPSFISQIQAQAIYARKLTKEDGHIDWNGKGSEIINRLRAMKDWPGSYFFYEGKRIIVLEAQVLGPYPFADKKPGTVLAASAEEGVLVVCRDGVLSLKKLKAEGKRELSAQDFLNGFRLKKDALLE